MYPDPDLLQEVGRVTIAGFRLDVQMGLLWHRLDRSQPFEDTRWKPGAVQSDGVRALAMERLTGHLQQVVLAAVDAADDARRRRNEVVHQDWPLRTQKAMRPVADWGRVPPEERDAYLADWEREATESQNWQRLPQPGHQRGALSVS